jgi:hypothetical protein
VAQFQDAGATSIDRATTTASLGVHEGVAFRTLLRHAILRRVGEQSFYLDNPSWEAHQKNRRRLAFVIPGLVVLAGFVFWIVRR